MTIETKLEYGDSFAEYHILISIRTDTSKRRKYEDASVEAYRGEERIYHSRSGIKTVRVDGYTTEPDLAATVENAVDEFVRKLNSRIEVIEGRIAEMKDDKEKFEDAAKAELDEITGVGLYSALKRKDKLDDKLEEVRDN